ncbi:MAG: hypothetical protein ACYTFW_24790 [Planctomycetota bacterium]
MTKDEPTSSINECRYCEKHICPQCKKREAQIIQVRDEVRLYCYSCRFELADFDMIKKVVEGA